MKNKYIDLRMTNQDAVDLLLNVYPHLSDKGKKEAFLHIRQIVKNLEVNFYKLRNKQND